VTAPVRATTMRVHRWTGDRWEDTGPLLGAATVTFTPAYLEDAAEDYVARHQLPASTTVTVAFHPSRQLRRLLMGPRWAWDRHRLRTTTRRKARGHR